MAWPAARPVFPMTSDTSRRVRPRVAAAVGLVALGLLIGAAVLRHRPAHPVEAAPVAAAAVSAGGEAAAPERSRPPEPATACPPAPSSGGAAARSERTYVPPAAELVEWMREREPLQARWQAESGDPSWN